MQIFHSSRDNFKKMKVSLESLFAFGNDLERNENIYDIGERRDDCWSIVLE